MSERTKHSLISATLPSTLQMFMKTPMAQGEKAPAFLSFLYFSSSFSSYFSFKSLINLRQEKKKHKTITKYKKNLVKNLLPPPAYTNFCMAGLLHKANMKEERISVAAYI